MKIYKSFRRALMLLTIVCSDMHGHQLTDSLFPHAGTDSTELDYATSRYFQALYRIVNKTFHPAVLEEFHQIADALASCVAAHEDYFTAYPDAKAAYGLMVQIPDILEQNLELNADGNYVLRELPEEWLFCIFELWHYVYPGVYGAEHSTENCTDAVLLKWIAG